MRLLVLSDLHLESNHFSPLLPDGTRVDANADMVVLAGDIHEGTRGIRWARETFSDKGIIYVAGNHEFYDGHWTRTLDDMREAANTFDVDFLEADALEAGGILFLGLTLWTDFFLMYEDRTPAIRHAKAVMNDYRSIKISRTPETHFVNGQYLTPELTALRHRGSLAWLEERLSKGDDHSKTVVITHHAPSGESVPARYKDDLTNAAYASDLGHMMGKAGLWIHGHIHTSTDYEIQRNSGTTRIICNPRGNMTKDGSFENVLFNPSFVVEV
jgi:predicted phosphodiesterase